MRNSGCRWKMCQTPISVSQRMRVLEANCELEWDWKGREEEPSCCSSELPLPDANVTLRPVDTVSGLCSTSGELCKDSDHGAHTQLALGSRNLHHTPSSLISFIFLHRFRKTLSILFLKSIMLVSSFAFVGLAA